MNLIASRACKVVRLTGSLLSTRILNERESDSQSSAAPRFPAIAFVARYTENSFRTSRTANSGGMNVLTHASTEATAPASSLPSVFLI